MTRKPVQYVQVGKARTDLAYTPKRARTRSRKRSAPFWTYAPGESRAYRCADSNLMLSRTQYVARTMGWKFRVHQESPGVVRVWRVK